MRKPKKPDAFEQGILDVVLVELRRSVRNKDQLSLIVDPFMSYVGAYVHASSNKRGMASYEIDATGARMR